MPKRSKDGEEPTYPLRTAARLTGLSPELLRAWERRYGVVQPARTPGGTRRYTAADLERLGLVKAAVDAGHRIGQVASLDAAELKRRAAVTDAGGATDRLEAILASLDSLEAAKTQRLLGLQLSALGPAAFAREVGIPLVHEIGDRWARGELGIAQEHLASAVLRSLLGSALQPTSASHLGPRLVFSTPAGERHELGLLMAALTSVSAGANPIYLGCDLPVEDLLGAVVSSGAAVLALSIVTNPKEPAERFVAVLRRGLPSEVHLWIGGAGAVDLDLPPGAEHIETLEELERRVALLVTSRAYPARP